jgi:hypothetical protein
LTTPRVRSSPDVSRKGVLAELEVDCACEVAQCGTLADLNSMWGAGPQLPDPHDVEWSRLKSQGVFHWAG